VLFESVDDTSYSEILGNLHCLFHQTMRLFLNLFIDEDKHNIMESAT